MIGENVSNSFEYTRTFFAGNLPVEVSRRRDSFDLGRWIDEAAQEISAAARKAKDKPDARENYRVDTTKLAACLLGL